MVKFVVQEGESLSVLLLDPLFRDIARCDELMEKEDSQFIRRCYVRAVFAFLEADLQWLREEALRTLLNLAVFGRTIPVEKVLVLMDQVPKIDNTGKLSLDPARYSFTSYLAFVLRTFAEIHGHDPERLFSDNGWRLMKQALKVRHRITHPKEAEALEIKDEDIAAIRGALAWRFNSLADVVRSEGQQHGGGPVAGAQVGGTPTGANRQGVDLEHLHEGEAP
jgi:hypothetical protein